MQFVTSQPSQIHPKLSDMLKRPAIVPAEGAASSTRDYTSTLPHTSQLSNISPAAKFSKDSVISSAAHDKRPTPNTAVPGRPHVGRPPMKSIVSTPQDHATRDVLNSKNTVVPRPTQSQHMVSVAQANQQKLNEAVCIICGKPALCKCSNCATQFYCGRECQLKVWNLSLI